MREEPDVVEVKPSTARRRFSKTFKRELVEQTLRPDVSMAAVALANGLNTNQLARWRRENLLDTGASPMPLPALVPVRMIEPAPLAASQPGATPPVSGEIEWRQGANTIVLRGTVDEGAWCLLLAHLRGAR
ncbi:transposase [Robbsia sp. Bb-Pol-6]|uniref:Transposase n=1 Tax=Robbsia betulipollinis TaxID=2981849 RepID=A0ABT3ZTV0_9BURK|nr:transposase [Robbsia betulipollinis]MCY0389980.1 transposase [Robbsia betulipollinis]